MSSHRNTYARFTLVNVIQFNSSADARIFEEWVKRVLSKHSISKNETLEQYECKDQNTVEFVNKKAIEQFNSINDPNKPIGSICPKETIKKYNETMLNRTNE